MGPPTGPLYPGGGGGPPGGGGGGGAFIGALTAITIRLDYIKLPGGGGIDAGLGGTKWFSVNAKFYGTSAI